jgi:pilus assembly protein CpaB
MRRQAIFFLVLALLLGGLAALLALQVMRSDGSPVATTGQIETVQVVVADRDLPFGALVAVDDIRTVDWPANAVPDGFSRSASDVVGRGLLGPVRRNEPLLSAKLALPGTGAGLSINIPEGQRAMTFRVDDIVGVAGFIRPGHRVDVMVTVGPEAGTGQPTTKQVLQNVEVAATGHSIEPNPQGEPEQVPNVTLHLTPEQGERLIMAAGSGRIQLALRNPLDGDSVETPGVRLNQLLALAPAPRPVASAPTATAPARPQANPQVTLEVYRGNQRANETVDTSMVGGGGDGGGGS